MNRKEMQRQLKKIQPRLMAALSMLLISAVMLASTSYAWFVLSTAPEAADLTTVAGANGALEIALAGTVMEGDLKKPGEPYDQKVGASSAVFMQSVEEANSYWGNILDITESYGLSNIVLYPSRLNLSTSLDRTVLMNSPLVIPTFGTDGRIVQLKEVQKASFNSADREYYLNSDYGVHLLGSFTDGESADEDNTTTYSRQEVVDVMSNNVETARENIRSEISQLIADNSEGIFGLLIETGMVYQGGQYTDTYKPHLGRIISGLGVIADEALDSLRYAVMATAAADVTHYSNNDEEKLAELADMYAGLSEMTTDKMAQIASANGYTEINEAITAISSVKSNINSAADKLERYGVANALSVIFDPGTMQLNGGSGVQFFEALFGLAADPNHTGEMYLWSTGSEGNDTLFVDMAKIIGDYSASIEQYMTSFGPEYEGNYIINMYMTSGISAEAYNEETNTGVLAQVREETRELQVDGEFSIVSRVAMNKTAYGYCIDMAIKSNKAGNLKLQQEAIDRITGLNSTEAQSANAFNQDTMGQGSTMKFKPAEDIADVSALMESIYIVFMRTTDGYIYGVATADAESMTTNADGVVEAPLVLYSPNIQDGVIKPGNQSESILVMEADTTYFITAVVYLNGDAVTDQMLSSSGNASFNGSLNLQFASDANLTPMSYNSYVKPE